MATRAPLPVITPITTTLIRSHDRLYTAANVRAHERALRDGEGDARAMRVHPLSTLLLLTTPSPHRTATVRVLLPSIAGRRIFAGIRTALVVATGLAQRLGLPLEISVVERWTTPDHTRLQSLLVKDLGFPSGRAVVSSAWNIRAISTDDVWVATYWSTAHALDVASRLGRIDASRVVYLVQDDESDFFPASTEAAMAASTLAAGFTTIVNSAPLASTLQRRHGLTVDPRLVFRPQLDYARLALAAERRRRSAGSLRTPVVGFYARPTTPRNAFPLGIAALSVADRILSGRKIAWSAFSMGARHSDITLGATTLRARGILDWDVYFDTLADTDVLLSLQMTAHPSHPPLDAVLSGGHSVTNEREGSRGSLHPRLSAVPADPQALGERLAEVVVSMADAPTADIDPAFLAALGAPLGDVLDAAAEVVS